VFEIAVSTDNGDQDKAVFTYLLYRLLLPRLGGGGGCVGHIYCCCWKGCICVFVCVYMVAEVDEAGDFGLEMVEVSRVPGSHAG